MALIQLISSDSEEFENSAAREWREWGARELDSEAFRIEYTDKRQETPKARAIAPIRYLEFKF